MRRLAPALLLTAVTLAGCTAAPPAALSPSASPSAVDAVAIPSATQTPSERTYLSELDISVPLIDADGYGMVVDLKHRITSATVDATSEKPGETSVLLGIDDEYMVTNATEGRTLPFPVGRGMTSPLGQAQFNLWAGWPMDSTICQYGQTIRRGAPVTSEDGEHCIVMVSFGRIASDLAAGERRELEVFRGSPNGLGDAGVAKIPESEGPSVREQLITAPVYYLTFNGSDGLTRFTDLCDDPLEDGYRVVWSSTGSCTSVIPIRAKGYPDF